MIGSSDVDKNFKIAYFHIFDLYIVLSRAENDLMLCICITIVQHNLRYYIMFNSSQTKLYEL